jgi:phosphoheptose isomerase
MLTPTDWTGLDHYLGDFVKLLGQVDRKQVQTMVDLVEECYVKEKTVFIIGNGGSGANASHLCEDLGKGTLHDFEKQRRLKVMSLTDNTPVHPGLGQRHELRPRLRRAAQELRRERTRS